MEHRVPTKRRNIWMIIGIIFAIISVALGVILAFTYLNMPNRDEISAEAYEEAKAEYKDQVAQLQQYYELRLKKNSSKNSNASTDDATIDIEPEDSSANSLASIDPVKPTSATDYIYIPALNKKVKLDDSLKNIKYAIYDYGMCIWAVSTDAPNDDYSFTYSDGLSTALMTIDFTSKDYVDAILKIDSEDSWYVNLKSNSVVYNNGNYLTIEDASLTSDDLSADEYQWYQTSYAALLKIMKDKTNYEEL